MNFITSQLASGLYMVATPIGTARDITLRALDILASADVIAAEDTRSMRRLLEIHGVPLGERPLIPYHDHSGPEVRARLVSKLAEGASVAYASEAGTPLIADPGYALVNEALEAGHKVWSAPGPSAVLAALAVAGLPTDRFYFAGFLPPTSAARKTALQDLSGITGTLVFYESPRRAAAMLADCAEVLGGTRQAALCRELTKKFEEMNRQPLADLAEELKSRQLKGEVVVLIDRDRSENIREGDLEDDLRRALGEMSVKDAADFVSKAHDLPRRKVYQMALALTKE